MKRAYPSRPVVGVGAIIVHDGKILLAKRGNDPGKGRWSVPGGLVELGENVEQAVLREVKEETGLDVESPEHIDVVDNVIRDSNGKIRFHFVIIDYLVKLKGGALRADSDVEELSWVGFPEVEKHSLTETFRGFYVRNRKRLEQLAGAFSEVR